MEASRITPRGLEPDRDRAWLEQQHEHDLDALDRAADRRAHDAGVILAQGDVILTLLGLVARLRREVSVLILHPRGR